MAFRTEAVRRQLTRPSGGWSGGEISGVERIGEGWETDVWAFCRGSEALVVRIYSGTDAAAKAEREFGVMQRLHAAGYPVPAVKGVIPQPDGLPGPCLIMERIAGRPLGNRLQELSGEGRAELVARFAALAARLHGMPWQSLDPGAGLAEPGAATEAWLAWARKMLTDLGKAEAAEPLLAWLAERGRTVTCRRLSPLHGDLHFDNLLLRDDGALFVIDWSGAGVGDARHDLAWTLLLTRSYWGAEAAQAVLHHYEASSGESAADLDFFAVAALARRILSIWISLTDGAERLGMRPGLQAELWRQRGRLAALYAELQDRTGVALPGLELLLATGP